MNLTESKLLVRIAELREALQVLHDIMKMGGFDCQELDDAAALLKEQDND